ARLHDGELRLEPGSARRHLRPVRLLVDPPLPARLPLEVLDGVRDIGRPAVDAGRLERLVEEVPRRADERLSRAVLLVAGLLADEHRSRPDRALPEDRLRADLPQMAAATSGGRLLQRGEAQLL